MAFYKESLVHTSPVLRLARGERDPMRIEREVPHYVILEAAALAATLVGAYGVHKTSADDGTEAGKRGPRNGTVNWNKRAHWTALFATLFGLGLGILIGHPLGAWFGIGGFIFSMLWGVAVRMTNYAYERGKKGVIVVFEH